MTGWLWGLVLIPAVWLAHWGAERLAKPLKKARRRWGLTEVAGAAFVGLAAASPEIGINTTSAIRGVGDIGLGASLGSNILAIPLIVVVAYWASRKPILGEGKEPGESEEEHRRHREEGLLRIKREAVWVQALPYLALVGLFAMLVLPAEWRGLQPLDGWIFARSLPRVPRPSRPTGQDGGCGGREVDKEGDWEGSRRCGGSCCGGLLHRPLNRGPRLGARHPKGHWRDVHHGSDGGAARGVRHLERDPEWTGDGGDDERDG